MDPRRRMERRRERGRVLGAGRRASREVGPGDLQLRIALQGALVARHRALEVAAELRWILGGEEAPQRAGGVQTMEVRGSARVGGRCGGAKGGYGGGERRWPLRAFLSTPRLLCASECVGLCATAFS